MLIVRLVLSVVSSIIDWSMFLKLIAKLVLMCSDSSWKWVSTECKCDSPRNWSFAAFTPEMSSFGTVANVQFVWSISLVMALDSNTSIVNRPQKAGVSSTESEKEQKARQNPALFVAHFAALAAAFTTDVEHENEHTHQDKEEQNHCHGVRDDCAEVELLDCRLKMPGFSPCVKSLKYRKNS